jgi:hypothetical protein
MDKKINASNVIKVQKNKNYEKLMVHKSVPLI